MDTKIVKLNVGGRTFMTTAATLAPPAEPNSLFAAMFRSEKRMPVQKDADGNILIDRDPDSFAVILTFLRTGMLDQELPRSMMERLKVEADYFGIEGITKIIRPGKEKVDELILLYAEYEVRAAELHMKLQKMVTDDYSHHAVMARMAMLRAAEDYENKAADLRAKS